MTTIDVTRTVCALSVARQCSSMALRLYVTTTAQTVVMPRIPPGKERALARPRHQPCRRAGRCRGLPYHGVNPCQSMSCVVCRSSSFPRSSGAVVSTLPTALVPSRKPHRQSSINRRMIEKWDIADTLSLASNYIVLILEWCLYRRGIAVPKDHRGCQRWVGRRLDLKKRERVAAGVNGEADRENARSCCRCMSLSKARNRRRSFLIRLSGRSRRWSAGSGAEGSGGSDMWKPYTPGPSTTSMREAGRCAGVTGRSDLDDRSAGAADTRVDLSIIILLLAALCYNALLAIINAHVRPLSVTQAAASEFLILAAAAGLMIARGLRPQDAAPLGLGIAFFFGSLNLSIANDQPVVAMMRNVAIIVVFTMLGGRCNRATIRAVFLLSVAIVLAVMIVEMSSISTYSSIFNPFKYYKNTRGLGEDISEDIGLFSNALGFEGRFNFGVFSTPRTSSIFLEQTSLANFASFCVIYLVSLWRSTNRAERWLGISFVSLALLSNNTRTASLLTLISLAGFFIFPLLPRRGTLALPFLVLALAWMATTLMGVSHEDDLAGRVGLSLKIGRASCR